MKNLEAIVGFAIFACWFGMAWSAYHSEWSHLIGWLIAQIALGLWRDAIKETKH